MSVPIDSVEEAAPASKELTVPNSSAVEAVKYPITAFVASKDNLKDHERLKIFYLVTPPPPSD